MGEFVFKIDRKDADTLGAVRCVSGLQATEDQDMIWIRGLYDSTGIDIKLRQLPIKSTFAVDDQNNLFLPGGLTPVATLKEMHWQPLASFIKVELPVSAMPGRTDKLIKIKLTPSVRIKQGDALLTKLSIWKNYAETAPAARLNFLRFAVSEKNEVLITGYPLPSLPGTEYWLTSDILLPCGYDFDIKLTAIFIKEQFNKNNDYLVIFDTEGHWQKISKNLFVPAKRSAIRSTKGNNTETGND